MLTKTAGWPDLQLLEAAPILVWRAGADAKCDWFNPAWLAYRGRTLEQESGDGWAEGVHPDDFDRCLRIYLGAFARQQRFEMEYRILRGDGEYGWIVDYGMPISADNGAFLGYMGYCFDVTTRRRSEESLRRRESELRAIYDASNVAIFHIDRHGMISQENRHAAEMFGFLPGQLSGADYFQFLQPEDRASARANLDRAFNDPADMQVERLYQRQDGGQFWGRLSIERARDDAGNVSGIVAVVVDITDRRMAELELERVCRTLQTSNAELEQFAYVASHDLREPLRMVSSYISLLERRYAQMFDQDGKDFLGFIRDGAQRMDRMVLDLLAFSRIDRRGAPIVPMSAADAMAAALDNLKIAIDESGAQVQVDLPALPAVMGDIHQIISLFQNVIGNALKYHQPGKQPHIRVDCRNEAPLWHFTVADDGIGIAPEFHDRIFQLFQRLHTREAYEGTGIGLAMCKKIVERHQGAIWVDSAPDQGTTFHFTLREADEAETEVAAPCSG
ncbi:MAG TPA: PAS domain S-box protein [Magnetospirillum sp.]|nr:PAS domain S-box protein [Magnetospirillum sp.]